MNYEDKVQAATQRLLQDLDLSDPTGNGVFSQTQIEAMARRVLETAGVTPPAPMPGYPYLEISRRYEFDYGHVLTFASLLERRMAEHGFTKMQGALPVWLTDNEIWTNFHERAALTAVRGARFGQLVADVLEVVERDYYGRLRDAAEANTRHARQMAKAAQQTRGVSYPARDYPL